VLVSEVKPELDTMTTDAVVGRIYADQATEVIRGVHAENLTLDAHQIHRPHRRELLELDRYTSEHTTCR